MGDGLAANDEGFLIISISWDEGKGWRVIGHGTSFSTLIGDGFPEYIDAKRVAAKKNCSVFVGDPGEAKNLVGEVFGLGIFHKMRDDRNTIETLTHENKTLNEMLDAYRQTASIMESRANIHNDLIDILQTSVSLMAKEIAELKVRNSLLTLAAREAEKASRTL